MPFEEKCNLGEEQRNWVRKEIEESTAEYTVIAAGVQVLTDDRINEMFFPRTRDFLISIKNPKTSN